MIVMDTLWVRLLYSFLSELDLYSIKIAGVWIAITAKQKRESDNLAKRINFVVVMSL